MKLSTEVFGQEIAGVRVRHSDGVTSQEGSRQRTRQPEERATRKS
jgi:hypothetical protein